MARIPEYESQAIDIVAPQDYRKPTIKILSKGVQQLAEIGEKFRMAQVATEVDEADIFGSIELDKIITEAGQDPDLGKAEERARAKINKLRGKVGGMVSSTGAANKALSKFDYRSESHLLNLKSNIRERQIKYKLALDDMALDISAGAYAKAGDKEKEQIKQEALQKIDESVALGYRDNEAAAIAKQKIPQILEKGRVDYEAITTDPDIMEDRLRRGYYKDLSPTDHTKFLARFTREKEVHKHQKDAEQGTAVAQSLIDTYGTDYEAMRERLYDEDYRKEKKIGIGAMEKALHSLGVVEQGFNHKRTLAQTRNFKSIVKDPDFSTKYDETNLMVRAANDEISWEQAALGTRLLKKEKTHTDWATWERIFKKIKLEGKNAQAEINLAHQSGLLSDQVATGLTVANLTERDNLEKSFQYKRAIQEIENAVKNLPADLQLSYEQMIAGAFRGGDSKRNAILAERKIRNEYFFNLVESLERSIQINRATMMPEDILTKSKELIEHFTKYQEAEMRKKIQSSIPKLPTSTKEETKSSKEEIQIPPELMDKAEPGMKWKDEKDGNWYYLDKDKKVRRDRAREQEESLSKLGYGGA